MSQTLHLGFLINNGQVAVARHLGMYMHIDFSLKWTEYIVKNISNK